jgi:hypothetical protein
MKLKLITHIDRINYFSDGFIEYYKKFFHPEEFYFLVYYSKNYKEIISYLSKHGFDVDKQVKQYNLYKRYVSSANAHLQNEVKTRFIKEGFTVVYSPQDERLFHPDLRNYIINNLKDYIRAKGIVIVQHNEPSLDTSKPLLSQRNYCVAGTTFYDKTSILKKDFAWTPGRHNSPKVLGEKIDVDENIYLIDIGKSCIDIALENNKESVLLYEKLNNYYHITDRDAIEKKFAELSVQPIPEAIKKFSTFF